MPLPREVQNVDLDYLLAKDWWSRVDVRSVDECWLWQQSVGSHGYGQTWDGSGVYLAHRIAWSLHHAKQVPSGMTIDHICRVQRCCNPHHLRLLTNLDNATDNGQANKTHCPRGHEYDGTNLYVDPKGHRRCRECARITRRLRSQVKESI